MDATISVAIEPLIRKKIDRLLLCDERLAALSESMGCASSSLAIISMRDRFCWKKVSFQQNSTRHWARPLCKKRMSGWTGSLPRR